MNRAYFTCTMPLFGKSSKGKEEKKEEKKDKKMPSVEDKYDLKDILGT